MPELPEITAHAERLEALVGGGVLKRFEPLSFTALKTFAPPPDTAHGAELARVRVRGKHLLLDFGVATFVVHLMQGGRLRPDTSSARRPRNGVARWHFADGSRLLLTEAGTEKRAGVWVVAGDPLTQEPLVDLGPDADEVTVSQLTGMLETHSMRLHTLLRDQRVIAGIGRRLANEICHRAKLSPFTQTRALDEPTIVRLHTAIREIIAEGLVDERARETMSASKDRPVQVHGRTGQPCPVCGDEVREITYNRYTVNYCATCQTDGRILADNALSRLGVPKEEWGRGRQRD
ncbi:MAG: Fpg/Nei family DNA glycosylase [Actinobacteria bacterium]|nr:Fpg/Nei family DNA glycosylase [Actinomycetota bacterium]